MRVVAPVVPVGGPVALAGRLPRAGGGRRVVVQQRRGGDWSVVARTRTSSRGVFEVRLEETEQRVHRYRAVVRRSPDGPRARTRPALTRVAPRVEEITAGLVDSEAYGHHDSIDVSADGRFVSWDSRGGDPDVFVWDRTRQRLALISPRTSQRTWGGSLSADGAVAAISTYNSAIRPDQPGRTDYAFPGLVDLRAGLFAPLLSEDGRVVGEHPEEDASCGQESTTQQHHVVDAQLVDLAGVGGGRSARGEIAVEKFTIGIECSGGVAQLLEAVATAQVGLYDSLSVGPIEHIHPLVVGDGL